MAALSPPPSRPPTAPTRSTTSLREPTSFRKLPPPVTFAPPPRNSDTYVVHMISGATVAGLDFANAAMCDCDGRVTNISYLINGCKVVTDLRGNTNQGDIVQVTFTVTSGAPVTLSLVSYTAPDPYFDANDASQQQIFEVDTGTFGPGTYTLTVHLPHSFYQVDFVCGIRDRSPRSRRQQYLLLGPVPLVQRRQRRLRCAGQQSGLHLRQRVLPTRTTRAAFDSDESGIAYVQDQADRHHQLRPVGQPHHLHHARRQLHLQQFEGGHLQGHGNRSAGLRRRNRQLPAAGAARSATMASATSSLGSGVNGHNYNFGETPVCATASACFVHQRRD